MPREHNKRYSPELKKAAVKAYLAGEGSQEDTCKKYKIKAKRQEELQNNRRRLEELDRLISSLYENFASDLLPERQYRSLMQKYSDEQVTLETRCEEIEEELAQAKTSTIDIGRFIKLIRKYKEPEELTASMACELIDKIVVHESTGKRPNRQQQVDIYFNFIGEFDLPLSEEELAQANLEAKTEAAALAKYRADRQRERCIAFRARAKAARLEANEGHKFSKKVCEVCGKEYYPSGVQQRYCSPECKKAHQLAEKKNKKRRSSRRKAPVFKPKACILCGEVFRPTSSAAKYCSEECKIVNRRERQLDYYFQNQSKEKT